MSPQFFSLTLILAIHLAEIPPGARPALVRLAFDIAHEENA